MSARRGAASAAGLSWSAPGLGCRSRGSDWRGCPPGRPPACDHGPVRSRCAEWAVAGSLAGWAAARLAGADRPRFAEAQAVPLLSLTPQAAAGAWIASLLLRGAGPAAVTAAAA